jgi:hypothetical protein
MSIHVAEFKYNTHKVNTPTMSSEDELIATRDSSDLSLRSEEVCQDKDPGIPLVLS